MITTTVLNKGSPKRRCTAETSAIESMKLSSLLPEAIKLCIFVMNATSHHVVRTQQGHYHVGDIISHRATLTGLDVAIPENTLRSMKAQ